ncbi:hypothetical protein LX99_01479 [Mucilaginibacter oryzae]|uniref:Uncharacterized protein n=1 Tax=Mucilaginibacter oryzae TaxID=468058 RepID=A0A316HLC5_9SPHI|nr:hypothetical protein [Mucilaginibacter oryzae]PWK79025.1 hypothetical protein LX99_01479 [Mucilaginibacter oryzae]
MKKSDIYEVAIKILGIYLLVADISKLPGLLTFMGNHVASTTEQGSEQGNLLLVNGLNFIFLIVLAIFLIAYTKTITRWLTHPSDYQENAKLFAERKVIFEIALMIIGGLLLVGTIPDFLYHLYNLISVNDQSIVISAGAKIFIGIITVVFAKRLGAYFAK